MTEKRSISSDEAAFKYGVVTEHEQMPNGEVRFRLFGSDQNGYIRTVASESGGWQRSHTHTTFKELYLVESGWMAMAIESADPEIPIVRIMHPGDSLISPINQTHNVPARQGGDPHH